MAYLRNLALFGAFIAGYFCPWAASLNWLIRWLIVGMMFMVMLSVGMVVIFMGVSMLFMSVVLMGMNVFYIGMVPMGMGNNPMVMTFLSLTFRRLHQHKHMITTNRRIGHLFLCNTDMIG